MRWGVIMLLLHKKSKTEVLLLDIHKSELEVVFD
jgi:hypothetical protein